MDTSETAKKCQFFELTGLNTSFIFLLEKCFNPPEMRKIFSLRGPHLGPDARPHLQVPPKIRFS